MSKDGRFISSKPLEELQHKTECRIGKKKIIGRELLNLRSTRDLAEHIRDQRPELL